MAAYAFWARTSTDYLGIVAFAVLAAGIEFTGFDAYTGSKLSPSFAVVIAATIAFGLTGGVAAALAVELAGFAASRKLVKSLFNVGSLVLAAAAAAFVLSLHETPVTVDDVPVLAPLALAATLANFGVNSALVASVIRLDTGSPMHTVFVEQFRWLLPHYFALGLLGLALAEAYGALGVFGLAVFALPPSMMRLAMKQYADKTRRSVEELLHLNADLGRSNEELRQAHASVLEMAERLERTYRGTLVSLVSALDARDKEAKGHSLRVMALALALASEMGIRRGSPTWTDLERGALLHDIGKIGISDAILHKPGSLNDDEWTEMREHPSIGHEMLKDIEFLRGAAEVVGSHHEWYDGSGYPLRLKGEAIPLGARIFAVADAFDAITSDRPYRGARPYLAAIREIRSLAGTQFDPEVVNALLRLQVDGRLDGYVSTDSVLREAA